MRARHHRNGQTMRSKGVGDFVTAVDLAAERRIRRLLREACPEHGILGEELPPIALDAEFVWVLDPIDGTSNFGRGLPVFAVSVACLHGGRPVAAAVHCLPDDVTYHAALGLGAFRGRQRLRLRSRAVLDEASILGVQWHRGPRSLGYLEPLIETGTRVRNLGSTVVHLADVADGRLDGNIQEQGRIWDFAAAALLVTEAGGRFTGWDGTPIFPVRSPAADRHYPSVAARPAVHAQVTALLGPFANTS